MVRSQQQALTQLADNIDKMHSSQIKKSRENIEVDFKRDALFLKHKKDEAERNRQHELKLLKYMLNLWFVNLLFPNLQLFQPAHFRVL